MDRRNKKPSRFNIAREMADLLDALYRARRSRRGPQHDPRSQRKDASHGRNAPVFSEASLCERALSGFALLIVNGLTNLTAALLLLKKKKLGVILGGIFGITLMLWICIQFYMFEFNFMSTVYFIFGLCQAVTGFAAWRLLRREEGEKND